MNLLGWGAEASKRSDKLVTEALFNGAREEC